MLATRLYFLGTEHNKTEIFIYGLSLPTKCDIEYSLKPETHTINIFGKKLYIFKSVIDVKKGAFSPQIDLDIFYNKPKCKINHIINIVLKKDFIQKKERCNFDHEIESPISSLVNMTAYYTKEIFSQNFSNDDYLNLLNKMSELSTQPFYGKYLNRLGCFEIAKVQSWAENDIPFGIKYDETKNQYYFYKDEVCPKKLYVVLKCYHTRMEKAYEKMIYLSETQTNYYFDFFPTDDWGHKFSVYDEDGNLLHEDCVSYIRSIQFGLKALTGSQKIKDAFSERDPKLDSISSSHDSSFSVDSPKVSKEEKYFENVYEELNALVDETQKSDLNGCWFQKSKDNLSDIISYISKHFLNLEQVVIIDPYADSEIVNFSIRLPAKNVTVIASKKALAKSIIEENIKKIILLKDKIKKAQGFSDNSKYYFVNKDFHDRFMLLTTSTKRDVFCLPNSINAMLKNNDYLILRLQGKVREQALKHIDELISLCKEENLMENCVK